MRNLRSHGPRRRQQNQQLNKDNHPKKAVNRFPDRYESLRISSGCDAIQKTLKWFKTWINSFSKKYLNTYKSIRKAQGCSLTDKRSQRIGWRKKTRTGCWEAGNGTLRRLFLVSSPTQHQHLPINQAAREMIVAYIICGPCHCSADGSILMSKCRVTRPLRDMTCIFLHNEMHWKLMQGEQKWVTSFVSKCGGGEMSALNTLGPLFLESSSWFIACKVATSRTFVKQKCIHKPAVSQANRNPHSWMTGRQIDDRFKVEQSNSFPSSWHSQWYNSPQHPYRPGHSCEVFHANVMRTDPRS